VQHRAYLADSVIFVLSRANGSRDCHLRKSPWLMMMMMTYDLRSLNFLHRIA